MITVSGKHFIFTRVESEYSPNNKGGFQVYYSSKGIADSDLQLLVATVNCFSPKDSNVVRKQFFRLPSQNFAFINTITENHPEITDRKRRTGNYLAHGIILEAEQFSKILFNPFKVFDGYKFLSSAEDMVKEFSQIDHHEPLINFDVNPYSPIEGGENFSEKALSLYQIALTSSVKKSGDIHLVGNNQEVDTFLRAMFQFAQPFMRPSCFFDTHAENCQIPSGLFGIIGASFKRTGAQNVIILSQNIPIPEFNPNIKENLYFQWLRKSIEIDAKDAYRFSSTAQILATAFHENSAFDEIILDLESSQSFYQVHKELVLRRLDETISSLTTPLVSKKMISYMLMSKTDIREILLMAASRSIALKSLSPIIRKMIEFNAPGFDDWKKSDWIKLQVFSQNANDMVALFWASSLGKNAKTRQSTCSIMSEDDYQLSLSLLFLSIEPKDFIPSSEINMKHLLSKILPALNNLDSKVFVEFILELHTNKLFEIIDALEIRVSAFDNKILTYLESKLPGLPEDSVFLKSMKVRRKAIGRPEGIKGIFYQVK
jgi:hypothetical protein